MAKSEKTTDHNAIKSWVNEHDGVPMKVKDTDKGNSALLRIGFPDNKNSDSENLEEISWDKFFKVFDDNKLALLYQPEDNDKLFTKLVNRDS
ncbi:hypothetical protein [Nafulsella turpanensis]|uniref:hypothetical protein n=1 Tax=Nafulsella turpanensis TaxID=1265690 RepID=UPI000366DABE|nr:hypothetical protein [Nafulsella turpanensis]